MMMGFGMFGLLFMVVFWAALIALALWAIGALFPGASRSQESLTNQNLSARQILDMRFARGELSRDQYELVKQDIS